MIKNFWVQLSKTIKRRRDTVWKESLSSCREAGSTQKDKNVEKTESQQLYKPDSINVYSYFNLNSSRK